MGLGLDNTIFINILALLDASHTWTKFHPQYCLCAWEIVHIADIIYNLSEKNKKTNKQKKKTKEKVSQTHDFHVTAWRSTTQKLPPYNGGPKTNKLLRSHKRTPWERDYVELAQARPNKPD